MSVTSSVSGAEARAADIIDLDRYMRAAVRPSAGQRVERLVVDAGAVGRRAASSSGSSARRPPAGKRHSHDSGVSDGSYVRRKQRTFRRYDVKPRDTSRHSSSSIREFKAVCERTLKEQQEQISRVAQLCERLAQPSLSERERDERKPPARERPRHSARRGRSATRSESSVASTSSQSSRDHKRKEKHSSDSCKTYKIIMTKLDELGRVFAARKQPLQPVPVRCAPPSSASVSVCDKFVATEPYNRVARSMSPTIQTVYTSVLSEGRRLQVARAGALDIAPRNNVLVDSVVKSECTSVCSARDLNHCGFDLDDPVHLYAQAKRLNPLTTHAPFESRDRRHVENEAWDGEKRAERGKSLCSLCRGYWRALWARLPSYMSRE